MSRARDLRALRKSKGISLADAAEHIGVTPEHLSRVEGGTRNLSLPAARRLARLLGVRDLDWFLSQLEGGSRERLGA